ncbi:hypothetical protein BDY17DRAFT_290674 [Neohortaea acidophila]|uniref:Uncharacterized protein n=1 Tax=Neohortaea acidophila TaxID=245834 RepID=A0A6A6Q3I5_9PEZI|nr:uncharacterized protein BDY17DRAFT_290674 [Neohortaea acidophila]KAF2485987.1 hypothetical protein BDY17DRAFT_290674 [Neohortaea acidophila]
MLASTVRRFLRISAVGRTDFAPLTALHRIEANSLVNSRSRQRVALRTNGGRRETYDLARRVARRKEPSLSKRQSREPALAVPGFPCYPCEFAWVVVHQMFAVQHLGME